MFQPKEYHGFPVMKGELPGLGHLHLLHHGALDHLKRAHLDQGPAVWVNMGFGTRLLFCLGPDSYDFYKNKVTTNSRGAYDLFGKGIGKSMIAHDGPAHSHVRSAMQPIFAHKNIAESSTGAMIASVIRGQVDEYVRLREFRLLHHTLELTLEVVLRVTGVQGADLAAWKHQYREFVLMAWPVPMKFPGSPRSRGEKGMNWLNREIRTMIARVRSGEQSAEGSLLGSLIAVRAENGQPLTDEELVDNIRVLYAAGHETTSSVLAWLTIAISKDRKIWDRLCAEVKETGWKDIPTSLDELKKLNFANALFREVVRFHSPSWYNPRKTTAEISFGGKKIPENTWIAISPAYLARSMEHYPDPDKFDISRWMKDEGGLSAYEISTFGGGPHFCIGYHLAWQESLQYLVGLTMGLTEKKLRPVLAPGHLAEPRYVPFGHPESKTRIRLIRST